MSVCDWGAPIAESELYLLDARLEAAAEALTRVLVATGRHVDGRVQCRLPHAKVAKVRIESTEASGSGGWIVGRHGGHGPLTAKLLIWESATSLKSWQVVSSALRGGGELELKRPAIRPAGFSYLCPSSIVFSV